MLSVANIGFLAVFLYVIAAVLSIKSERVKLSLFFTIIALILHLFVLWQWVILNWVNLSFYHALSFASIWVLLSLFATYRWYAINHLLTLILPIVALSLYLEILHPEGIKTQANIYLDTHILLSILAYSFLFIASILTIILLTQEKLLKAKKLTGLLQTLPPLTQTENTLFKIVWLGFLLLTTSLISGFIFLEDIFVQHLGHKTIFSLLSWIVFAVLLAGRIKYGWRGILAVKMTLIGFVLVLLAYFGSKMVQELLLT